MAEVSTHVHAQICRKKSQNKFIYKSQPVGESTDRQRWTICGSIQKTMMYLIAATSDKTQSTVIHSIQFL